MHDIILVTERDLGLRWNSLLWCQMTIIIVGAAFIWPILLWKEDLILILETIAQKSSERSIARQQFVKVVIREGVKRFLN